MSDDTDSFMRKLRRMQRMTVQCEHHRTPHIIRKFAKGGPTAQGTGWELRAATSAKGAREGAASKVEVEGRRTRGELREQAPGQEFDLDTWLAGVVKGGQDVYEPPLTIDEDGQVLGTGVGIAARTRRDGPFGHPRTVETHDTYDLTCSRCRKAGRPASYQRESAALFVLFDLLVAQGKQTVTPEFLARMEARRSSTGD